MSWEEEYEKMIQDRLTGFSESTLEHFHEKLEILPPAKWGSYAGIDMFFVPERIIDEVVEWNLRDMVTRKCYTINEFSNKTHKEMYDLLQNYINQKEKTDEDV